MSLARIQCGRFRPKKSIIWRRIKPENDRLDFIRSGDTLAVIGASAFSSSWDHGSNTETNILGCFIVGGSDNGSWEHSFFISASNNERRAAEIVFTNQKNVFASKK